eukprot:2027023-Alexandrium_andersonii.AAC.1
MQVQSGLLESLPGSMQVQSGLLESLRAAVSSNPRAAPHQKSALSQKSDSWRNALDWQCRQVSRQPVLQRKRSPATQDVCSRHGGSPCADSNGVGG